MQIKAFGAFGRNAPAATSFWRRYCAGALAGLACAAAATPAGGACPPRSPAPYDPREYQDLLNEIHDMGRVRRADFSIGDQAVYRLRRPGAERRSERMLELLRSLKPRLEEMQSYFPTPPSRPVLLIESRLDGFRPSLAFTDCANPGEERDAAEDDREAELTQHVISEMGGDLGELPEGLCLIVVYPDRLENDEKRRFALAHEWMHTMQNGFYSYAALERDWWAEGSAEWFAHKINDGVTARDHRIEEFFMRQKSCPLTEHSYDAQPFFFWGEQAFNTSWAISVGLGGEEYLTRPAGAAEILPPERWLDWAIAQAEQTITMPDGRALPAQAEPELMDINRACDAVIEGPPLSVQLREVNALHGGAARLSIEAGGAQLAIRGRGEEEWRRVTGTVEIDPPASPLTVAAIMPSGEALNARLSLNNSGGEACACHIGVWMEQATPAAEADDALEGALEALDAVRGMVPPEDRDTLREVEARLGAANAKDEYRFRSATPAIFDELEGDVETAYAQAGPLVTIRPGGTFVIDDPHTIQAGDTRISYHKYRHFGDWVVEDGVLKFDIEGLDLDGFVTSAPDYEPERISFTNESSGTASYVGGGGQWTVACEPGAMTLTPADGRDTKRANQAVFTKR